LATSTSANASTLVHIDEKYLQPMISLVLHYPDNSQNKNNFEDGIAWFVQADVKKSKDFRQVSSNGLIPAV
jgi:hypothetical protein